jgi:hypothetical protein
MSHSKFMSAIMNDDFEDFDMIEYVKLKRQERAERKRQINEVILEEQKKKKFRPRKTYLKRNPRMSNWWKDYVMDERGTFGNLDQTICLSLFILI